MAKSKLTGGKKVNKLIKELKKISEQPSNVVVGLPKDASPYPDGTSVIMVGLVNEFGSSNGNIPERSFLRSAINENKQDLIRFWKKNAQAILTRQKNSKKVLSVLGTMMQSLTQQKIVDLKSPANANTTIISKKSSNPLIDTGHLRQSVRWEVR